MQGNIFIFVDFLRILLTKKLKDVKMKRLRTEVYEMTKKNTLLSAICLVILVFIMCSCSSSDLINSYRYKISDKELELKIGEGYALSVIGTSSADIAKTTIEWSTSDEKTATVDENGFVVANAEGTATVTAKVSSAPESSEKINVSYSCKVKVVKNGVTLQKFGYPEAEIEIVKGQTYTPRLTVYPGNADNRSYTVTSSDENIVSVLPDGKISGVAVGKATITAKTDDGTFSSVATVTVSAEKNLVTKFVLDKDSLSLTEGDTEQLAATVTPSNLGLEITWSSSDPTVASVSSKGIVTAKNRGKATITATVHDILSEKTATCEVTVGDESKEIKATGLSLSPDSLTITSGDTKVYNFKATVTPSNTTNVVSWTSSNPSLIYVNSRTGDFQLKGTVTETTTVTITCRVGALSKKGTVTVNPANEKLPTITVTPSMKSSFKVGDKSTLTLTFSPSVSAAEKKQLVISFDDSFTEFFNISTNDVGDYTITAIKEGSGTLRFTVSSSTGRYEYKASTHSFNIGTGSETGNLVISTNNELSLKVGETSDDWFSLKKNGNTVTAAEAGVKFSSEDSSVATVDAHGKITAKSEGKTTVTVTDGKVSRSIAVTVTSEQKVTHSLKESSNKISAEKPVTFTFEVSGSEISDIAISVSDSENFTAEKSSVGKTQATAYVAVKDGAAPSGTVTVSITVTLKNGQTVKENRTLTVE